MTPIRKFKKGDKVHIIDGRNTDHGWVSGMNKTIDNVCLVRSINSHGSVWVDNGFIYAPTSLKLVESAKRRRKPKPEPPSIYRRIVL